MPTDLVVPDPNATAELERLGDEIAELSAHLEPPVPVSSTSSESSTLGPDGTTASARARRG
jgi:hypothetical protein